MSTRQTDTDDVGAPRDLETQDVPEDDGVLQPEDSLETDDLSADALDTGVSASQVPISPRDIPSPSCRPGHHRDGRRIPIRSRATVF
jgi:hypothetical protein